MDFAPYRWDTETTGPSNGLGTVAKGVGWYVDGGKRYGYKDFPKAEPKFFSDAGAVSEAPIGLLFPTGEVSPGSPCEQCPSSGGTG